MISLHVSQHFSSVMFFFEYFLTNLFTILIFSKSSTSLFPSFPLHFFMFFPFFYHHSFSNYFSSLFFSFSFHLLHFYQRQAVVLCVSPVTAVIGAVHDGILWYRCLLLSAFCSLSTHPPTTLTHQPTHPLQPTHPPL